MRMLLSATALLLPVAAGAQTVAAPIALGTTPYAQNFDTLASTGATGSALPAGFQIIESGSNANATYGVSTGSGTNLAGNSYSFGATNATDRALGSVASGSLTQILFGGVLTNAADRIITDLTFAYTGEQWRLANSTDDGLTFQYLVGATGIGGTGWTTVAGLGFVPLFTNGTSSGAGLNGNLSANQRALSGTIAGLSLAVGQSFGFRWVDTNSTGSDQGLAVDDLTVAATLAPVVGIVPEPTSWALLIGGFGLVGGVVRRRRAGAAFA